MGRKKAQLPTPRMLVFDEIDIGIGGRAAEAVGRKLKTLARRQQVVCITHLPQIAAFADQHFLIEKAEKGGRTRTSVRRMEEGERAQEIARMLSGAKLTESEPGARAESAEVEPVEGPPTHRVRQRRDEWGTRRRSRIKITSHRQNLRVECWLSWTIGVGPL